LWTVLIFEERVLEAQKAVSLPLAHLALVADTVCSPVGPP
jgi:hypothetical protein